MSPRPGCGTESSHRLINGCHPGLDPGSIPPSFQTPTFFSLRGGTFHGRKVPKSPFRRFPSLAYDYVSYRNPANSSGFA